MTKALSGSTVIVTGGSRGLGKAIALAFAAEGAKVGLLCRRSYETAREVARQIEREGGIAWAYPCDVADCGAVNSTIGDVFRKAGSLDLIVNNAGVSHSSLLLKTDEGTWDAVLATNLTGAFNLTRAALPYMLRQRRGHIVNIGSLSAIQGIAGSVAYCASKAGLIGLTLSSAREYGSRGIAVNAVLPGYMPTEMGKAMPRASREAILSENVLGRGSTPEDVARFIVRLVHMEGVSGQVFNLDSRPWW
ncbi:MAG: SDR family NAD(P)-dependent oxidoreductase [bacterium]|nr:SDR family NAD(P)-dependent oxidoreductase [bacterium]